ncbi:U4/U6-U5 snRNP complex subunit prp31 [Cystobasidiomycetes sp. EMM_F5]
MVGVQRLAVPHIKRERTALVRICPAVSREAVITSQDDSRLFGPSCFQAWSPDPQLNDLCAVGLNTGRTILLRIHETPVYTSNPTPSILHLNVRHPRACNVVAFASSEPNLLVTGYDKVRDNSLLVWDIRSSFTSTSLPAASPVSRRPSLQNEKENVVSPTSQAPSRHRPPNTPTVDSKPIAQFGLSEQVSASTFMHNSKILVAAMAVKWLRAYDLRVPASASNNPTVVMSARGIISLVPDPFDNHRFASVGDDGMVRIWDLRQASEPFLTFSSEDGIAKHSKDRAGLGRTTSKISLATTGAGSAVTGDVTTVLYSTTRRGHIATLDRDSNYLSAWNIFEVGGKPERELFTPTTPHDGTGDEDSDNDSNAPVPTLYYERRTGHSPRPLSSFAFVPGSGGPQRFVTVNKDGMVEFCETKESPQLAFSTSGNFAVSWDNQLNVEGGPHEIREHTHVRSHNHRDRGHRSVHGLGSLGHLRIENLGSRQTSPERNRRSQDRRHRSTRKPSVDHSDDSHHGTSDDDGEELIPTLRRDISMVMRQRSIKGYGLDPLRNMRLVKDGLTELWEWIRHAAALSADGRAYVNTYDFGFKGVLPILRGFPAYSIPSPTTGTRTPHNNRRSRNNKPEGGNTGPATFADDDRSAVKRGDVSRAQDQAFSAAAAALNKMNNSKPFTTSSKPAQRQLALTSIGPDFASADIAAVIKRYEDSGQPSKAAAWALFSGNIELAVQSLKNNKDEKLKLLAPILASYLAQRDQQGNTHFRELCSALSTDLEDAFMRAMFAYIATGDWSEVLEEDALPLKDRVGIALRFLHGEELDRKLDQMAKKATREGDLQGILLTGLDQAGLSILQSYIDRTGDVQTAALAAAFVHPGQYSEPRAERWIEAYRKLLDHWELYTIRARFDIARGSKMRSSLLVKGIEETSVAIGSLLAPPHM